MVGVVKYSLLLRSLLSQRGGGVISWKLKSESKNMCFKWLQNLHFHREEKERKVLGGGLMDIWKVYREEVPLEQKLKLQAEQKASAPHQTIDSLLESGFCLQMLKGKLPHLTFCHSSVTSFGTP